MTKMQKRRSSRPPKNPTLEDPVLKAVPSPVQRLAAALARYRSPRTPAQRRRISKAAYQALGHAESLRGAAKASAMRKLAGMGLENIVDTKMLRIIKSPQWARKEKVTK